MKIIATVLSVKDCGDFMEVDLQGKADADAEWFGLKLQTFRINPTARNRRSYWLGREVEITITPKR